MIEDFYNETAVVLKEDRSQASTGGVKRTWSVRIQALPCRIANRRPIEVVENGKVRIIRQFRMYCEASAANREIDHADRVECGGVSYEITGIANPASLNHHLEIDLLASD